MTRDPAQDYHDALHRLLPLAIARTAQSYHDFSETTDHMDAKSFAAYHAACKTALGHLDALTKLTRFLETHASKGQKSHEETELLFRQARDMMEVNEKPRHENQENQL